ncbi:hypothetical protein SeMB42_g03272 [Synchytrium endobioticum]|uniref:Uncharacterized protein n=1 Tax=Synchytrium endobioticum TaxID=286115 RepID=A0A507D8E2_9FUNG|nr:hypothetical protein SeMB42_g03272 [Synchytrium endobioticum]
MSSKRASWKAVQPLWDRNNIMVASPRILDISANSTIHDQMESRHKIRLANDIPTVPLLLQYIIAEVNMQAADGHRDGSRTKFL